MITFSYDQASEWPFLYYSVYSDLHYLDAIYSKDMTNSLYIDDHFKRSNYIRNMKKYWTELRNLAEEAMSKAQKTYAISYDKNDER